MKEHVRKEESFYGAMPRKYIDYVLVWETPSSGSSSLDLNKREDDEQKRRVFERNLIEEGLHLERETLEGSHLNFVKIYSSLSVLRRYTEILRLRMPMTEMDEDADAESGTFDIEKKPRTNPKRRRPSKLRKCINWCENQFSYDKFKFPPLNQRLNAIYSRDKEYLFDVNDRDFFTPSIRSTVVDFIIRRKRYSDNNQEDFAFGIERLISDHVYSAAYPLHDGDLKSPGSQRYLLHTEWASLKNSFKSQPLDHIKEYFGVNIGLYFAWLGFYTRMLIPASILGFLCFIYGIASLPSDEYSKKICVDNSTLVMCPLCSKGCQYWRLGNTCHFAKFTHVFDNYSTIIFAVLMSFWAAIFLEFWKRYSARITHKWDLSSFDITEEQPRLEYLSRLKRVQKLETDVVNTNTEPHVSFWKTKVPLSIFSLSSVLFLVSMACAVIVGVIAYRIFMIRLSSDDDNPLLPRSSSLMLISASAAGINLVVICIFNLFYSAVATYLTEMELHRTQTEFDDSLTLKIFCLQFINYYASIFYIAFFKGRFAKPPNKESNFLNEEKCGSSGCMTELCIQLAIIMVGKQFVGGVLEMTTPLVQKWMKQLKLMITSKRRHTRTPAFHTQWFKDYKLAPWHSRSLFSEYLEMILQYGFVTIFVAAFPLAPLFALVNNILEMRLDATKMLIYNRRPVGQRAKNIGIWYGILDTISRIAVISNALIIAFTSNFIPNIVYHIVRRGDSDDLFENSLVEMKIEHFDIQPIFKNTTEMSEIELEVEKTGSCWYQGYIHNHTAPLQFRYETTKYFWMIIAARLIFIVVFQNFVSMFVQMLKVLIPDVPKKLQKRIRHEYHLTNEIIIKQEMVRARAYSEQKELLKENDIPTTITTDNELSSDKLSSKPPLKNHELEGVSRVQINSKTPFDSNDDDEPSSSSVVVPI